ncbi:MAG TPA: NADH-quinone oxidoreductase subunit A [Desulfovibrio sp.]|jgi:NADH-quinone oxidoreductase subunit A|uniref:NADH-quinone oxidoreductase subunit A n=1 Tax=Desulfovibrio TaxID=872 RepID=UPI002A3D1576|nr:NADH-quinone oxidoreductase subunit A [Desulfovibrio sp.]MDY0307548.1 NADH-quinone oxidoreductase subunit A [Desulfovibrionaceae bacterium]HMM38087.1 NADH-quinone oxidoreductase subunit A [Desulfovibrio sp.]
MVFNWLHLAIILFLIVGILFAAGPLILAALVSPRARGGDIGMPYECGMKPFGSSWTQFGVNYYVYALIFLAFDVDVLYLFPVAVQYHLTEGWTAFVKVFIFLTFLGLSIVYFWAKGVFTWPHKIRL